MSMAGSVFEPQPYKFATLYHSKKFPNNISIVPCNATVYCNDDMKVLDLREDFTRAKLGFSFYLENKQMCSCCNLSSLYSKVEFLIK